MKKVGNGHSEILAGLTESLRVDAKKKTHTTMSEVIAVLNYAKHYVLDAKWEEASKALEHAKMIVDQHEEEESNSEI